MNWHLVIGAAVCGFVAAILGGVTFISLRFYNGKNAVFRQLFILGLIWYLILVQAIILYARNYE